MRIRATAASTRQSRCSNLLGPFDRLFETSEFGAKHGVMPEAGVESLIDERVLAVALELSSMSGHPTNGP
jgi:hypothetical protein